MAATAIDLGAIEPNLLYPAKLAAPILNKSEKTLANLRSELRGPAWHRMGGRPFYKGADLLKFIESSRVSNDFVELRPTKTARRQRRGVAA